MHALRLKRLFLALSLSLALPITAGCRPKPGTVQLDADSAAAHAAALERWLKKHPDDQQKRLELAHVYWLHLADPGRATEHLDKLTALDQALPLARFSRAVIAQNRLDFERAWQEHAALLREAPQHEDRKQRALALALSAYAARTLDGLDGSRPGDEAEFVALVDGLNLAAYPGSTREVLLSTRASIARRHEQDYRDFHAQQGCVQAWVVGELEGFRGPLELSRLEGDRSFKPDAKAKPTQLSCAFRVWNAEPSAAIRRLRTTVELPADQSVMRLSLGTQFDARVYVDDQLIWAKDRSDRYPVQSPTFVLPVGPGVHRIEVRTSIPTERAWLHVRATDADGNPLAVRADAQQTGSWKLGGTHDLAAADELLERGPWLDDVPQLRGPVYAPLRLFLALDDALTLGDSDRAEQLAERMRFDIEVGANDGFPEAHLLLADFEYSDPTRGKTSSAARQQGELERALELDPSLGRATMSLLGLRLRRGEDAEVIEALEAIDDSTLTASAQLSLAMLRFTAYRQRGSDFQAEQALARAEALHPQGCEVLMARRDLIRERTQVEAEDRIVEALASCPGSIGLRAKLASTRGRHEEAAQLYRAQLDRIPDDLDSMAALVELALADGRWDEAIAWHGKMLELAPYRALSQVELADLYARADDPKRARESLLAAIEQYPHNSRLRQIGERVGIPDELMRWRVDGMQALAEYRGDVEQGLASEGVAEVLLLDRQVSMLYANGGSRHIVHQMFHVLSDQSIDAHGEIVPPGVELLTLHSIKADGTIIEPESIPGKDGLSLRGLEIGDVVELEFVYESPPEPALPGHIDLGRFRFQSPEVPFHRSELVVLMPSAMESQLSIETRNDPPKPTRRSVSLASGASTTPYTELTFLARQVPRLGSEPGARAMLDEMPSVQVHVPLRVEDWLDQLSASLRPAQRSNPELRALALHLTEQYTSDYDKVDALWRWVVDEIEDAGDLTTPATATLAAGQGSRLMLLRALCEAAGVDTELWLLRDRFGPTIYAGQDPLVETYDTAMLAITGEKGKAPLLIGTSSEVIPLGYLSPSYANGRALRVQLDADEPASGYVDVPPNPERLADRRRWDIEIGLDARGNGVLRGSIELSGLEAIMWRDVFDKVDADRLPEVFTQVELSRMLPGASLDLEQLEFDNQWALEQPLVMRFAARVQGGGVVQSGQLIMLASAVPIDPLTGFARLPSRWSGMVIGYGTRLEAKVRYVLDGASFSDVPRDVTLDGPWAHYERHVTGGGVGQGELVLESHATITPGIVEAEVYPDLAEFAGEIQAAEQGLLRAR